MRTFMKLIHRLCRGYPMPIANDADYWRNYCEIENDSLNDKHNPAHWAFVERSIPSWHREYPDATITLSLPM